MIRIVSMIVGISGISRLRRKLPSGLSSPR